MKLLTFEDTRDIYVKAIQRGSKFIFSKLSLSGKKRTQASFNNTKIDNSNWWIIPLVKERWNYLITGDSHLSYEEYISKKYENRKGLKLISIGSGVCSHELYFAKLNPSWEITCLDFSGELLQLAQKHAQNEGIGNIKFIETDIYEHTLPNNYYDIVLFHSSLHHFRNMNAFICKVSQAMADNGLLIINEYVGVNRIQYRKNQLAEINKCLLLIDKEYRKIFKTNLYKNRYYGSGIFRMIISDPSECVESENILPSIKHHFNTVEEKGYGGNLLMAVLKDISHHFIEINDKKKKCLNNIFAYEDEYLKQNKSDFILGIYQKK
ncbi:MAG: class I SAM-dependent methyltransferase [Bacteroidales bacterium]